jgi:hypothetical protein
MLYSLKQQDIQEVKVNYFGLNGAALQKDCDASLAKKVEGKRTQYFCKFNTVGPEAGHLVNPWSMYMDEAVVFKNTTNARTGKFIQEYREVTEEVFNLYVRYLSSRSDVHYRQAERMALENA